MVVCKEKSSTHLSSVVSLNTGNTSVNDGSSIVINRKPQKKLIDKPEVLTLDEEGGEADSIEQTVRIISDDGSVSQVNSKSGLEIDEISIISNKENFMVEMNKDDHDRLLRKLKEDFEVYREQTEITNINENEDIGGYYFTSSNEDIIVTSDVDSKGVTFMLVLQISLIPDYLELEEKNNEKLWFLTSEVYKKLRMFVEGTHNIVAKHNQAERKKNLEKLMNEVKDGLKDKRYENGKCLMKYSQNTTRLLKGLQLIPYFGPTFWSENNFYIWKKIIFF